MKNIEQISLDCMIQHFKTFYEQSIDEREADFGQPCATCPHIEECRCNWYENIAPLLQESEIHVEFPLPNKEWDKEEN